MPTDPVRTSSPAHRRDRTRRRSGRRTVVEWVVVLVCALMATLVVRTWVFESYVIPSASMEPTIHIGDRMLVDKLSYDLGGHPETGQIVVFRKVTADSENTPILIKRVIGLPGQTLRSGPDGEILVDGRILREPWLPRSEPDGPAPAICTPGLTNEAPQATADCVGSVLHLPRGEYFVMGDNRGDSYDSRFFGPVPAGNIIGRAFVRIWPVDRIHWF